MADARTSEKMTPVPVTRGSKQAFSAQMVDWIEGTFRGREMHSLTSILSPKYVECKAFHGYTSGSRFDDGRVEWTNPGRPEMGRHITWTGDACARCPIDPLELVKHLGENFFSFTRLDLAIDAHNFKLRPRRAEKEIKRGRCKTRAEKFPTSGDAKAIGFTQYIGAQTSEIYCRIYDKAAEMGVSGDHTRIELVVRQRRADKAARAIVRGADFGGLVVAFADFPEWREWRKVMATTPIKLPSERKETNTRLWLMRTCAPALAKEIFLTGDMAFLATFNKSVELIYGQLSSNIQTVY